MKPTLAKPATVKPTVPHPAALRASQKAWSPINGPRTVESLAELIDRETHLTELTAALESAYNLIGQCGGTALGIAMSGDSHPNPDEKLEELFHLCNDEALKLSRLLNEVKGEKKA